MYRALRTTKGKDEPILNLINWNRQGQTLVQMLDKVGPQPI